MIRRVNLATGIISTVAGSTGCQAFTPAAIAVDAQNNIFIADPVSNRIRMLTPSGILSVVAGTGTPGFSGDGGAATVAMLSNPQGLAIDLQGNILIADAGNQRIRRIDTSGKISTIAGNGTSSYGSGLGGPATSASVVSPQKVAIDSAGVIYIAEPTTSFNGDVFRIDPSTSVITRLTSNAAGQSFAAGSNPAQINVGSVLGLAVDSENNLYIAGNGLDFVDFSTPQFTLTPSAASISSASGTGSLTLTAASSDAIWIAASDSSWLTPSPLSGVGSGIIDLTFTANPTGFTRQAVVTTEGVVATVTQAGISATLTPATVSVPAAQSSGNAILSLPAGTSWIANSDSAWLTVSPMTGMGGANLTWLAAPNSTAAPRLGTITIAGKTLVVSQSGSSGIFNPIGTAGYGIISTVAGGDTGGDGGPAKSAKLNANTFSPTFVAADHSGSFYFIDQAVIRRVTAATGIISTIAGMGSVASGAADGGPASASQLSSPASIAADAAGNVFFTDVNRLRRIDAVTGILTTIAGGDSSGFGEDFGPAAGATLSSPGTLTIDAGSNIYLSDVGNARVRRIDGLTGTITTVAGNGASGSMVAGGQAIATPFPGLNGIAVDAQSDIFVTTYGVYPLNPGLWRIDAFTGLVTQLAPNAASPLIDPSGNLYVVLPGNKIEKADSSSGALTFVGGSGNGFACDGGPVANALFGGDFGTGINLATDAAGNLYIADAGNQRIRFVDLTTPPTTLAAGAARYSNAAATGTVALTLSVSGTSWQAFSNAAWLTVTTPSGSASGNIGYNIANNNTVFTRTGIITVNGQSFVVTQPGSSVSLSAGSTAVMAAAGTGNFNLTVTPAAPWTAVSSASWLSVTTASGSASGTITYAWTTNTSAKARTAAIFVAGRKFSVTQSGAGGAWVDWSTSSSWGEIQHIAGNINGDSNAGDYGLATAMQVAPTSLAADANGNLYFGQGSRVRRLDAATGNLSPVAGNGLTASSGDGGPALQASLQNAASVAIDSGQNIFIVDTNAIRRVDARTAIITTVAGGPGAGTGGDGGPATQASFSNIQWLQFDEADNLYIGDSSARIRRIDAQTGIITTVAGTGVSGYSGDGGPAVLAQIYSADFTVDPSGNIFIADTTPCCNGYYYNNPASRIRCVDAATGLITTVAGTSSRGFSGDGGPANAATLSAAVGIATDPVGNLFFFDGGITINYPYSNIPLRIRKIDAVTETITTIAGGSSTTDADGEPAIFTSLASGGVLATDGSGNLYLTETQAIRAIDYTTPQISFATPPGAVPATTTGGSVGITVPSGFTWTATSNVGWLTLTTPTGIGNGAVAWTLAPNTTPFSRVGVINVSGIPYIVTQRGVPSSLSAPSALVTNSAGTGQVSLTTVALWPNGT